MDIDCQFVHSAAPPRPSPSTKSKSEHGRGPHAEREIGEDDDVQLISPPRMQSGAVDGVHPSRPFQPKPVKPSKASTKPHDQSSLSQPGLLGSRPKTKLKKHTTASDVEEEELNFGQPARPAKRRRRVSGTGLALPSTSAAVRDVQNLATSSREGIKNRVNLDVTSPSPPPVVAGADSESEEEWSEVETRPPAVAVATGTDSEGEDMDDLEAEMKRGFEELDKHSAAATPEPGIPNDQPISLHERASMNAAEPAQDYDDITSSEEESDSD